MAKSRPGLPDGFEINLSNPAQLGDYLDEDFAGNAAKVIVARRPAPPAVEAPKQVPAPVKASPPKPQVAESVQPPQPRGEPVLGIAAARKQPRAPATAFRRPERAQFNMRPETLKMFTEIVEFVQRYSLQNDAKASEIFDAVISILHDAKEEFSFADVPRRGKWGTPTARAFPTALGSAFARAIATRFARQQTE